MSKPIQIPAIALITACLALMVSSAWSQDQPAEELAEPATQRNILAEHFFSPDLILQNADQLNLGDQQRESIEKEWENLQANSQAFQENSQAAMAALEKQLEDPSAEDAAITSQIDQLLKGEFNMKRLEFHTLVRIRGQLEPGQREQLKAIRAQMIADQQQANQRIQAKIMRVQQILQQRGTQPPADILALMQSFQQLIQQGEVAQAEAKLDQALRQLQGAP